MDLVQNAEDFDGYENAVIAVLSVKGSNEIEFFLIWQVAKGVAVDIMFIDTLTLDSGYTLIDMHMDTETNTL